MVCGSGHVFNHKPTSVLKAEHATGCGGSSEEKNVSEQLRTGFTRCRSQGLSQKREGINNKYQTRITERKGRMGSGSQGGNRWAGQFQFFMYRACYEQRECVQKIE